LADGCVNSEDLLQMMWPRQADKGNATVVIDRKTYVEKMEENMLRDGAYGKTR
jgi:hypothetical protein